MLVLRCARGALAARPGRTRSDPNPLRRRIGEALRIGLAAVVAAVAVGAGTAPAGAGEGATGPVRVGHLAGADRYRTGVLVSRMAYPAAGSASAVIVARGDLPADALAGAALAGHLRAPILTTPTDRLPPEVAAEIVRVSRPGRTIVVLGGQGAVSPAVEDALAALGSVQRIAGANRHATSAAIARAVGRDGQIPVGGHFTALVANGSTFVDSLAVGPVAYQGVVVLTTDGVALDPEVLEAIDELGITQAVVVGGPDAVSAEVQAELASRTSAAVTRLEGISRYATAGAVATWGAVPPVDVRPPTVLVVDGTGAGDFADALFAGWYGGFRRAPLLLARSDLPAESSGWLRENAWRVGEVVGIGRVGPPALEQAAETVELSRPQPPAP